MVDYILTLMVFRSAIRNRPFDFKTTKIAQLANDAAFERHLNDCFPRKTGKHSIWV